MAISKERLKELIEQGATVCGIKDNGDEYLVFELYFDNVDLRPGYKIVDKEDGNKHLIFGENNPIEISNLENLFETEEDAEFALKYKRIPRTEYLDLPTWDELFKQDRCLDCYTKEFAITKNDIVTGICLFGVDFTNKVVETSVGADKIFVGELTKENYLEACEVARKLWLGI